MSELDSDDYWWHLSDCPGHWPVDLGQQGVWFYRRSLFFSKHDSFICQALYISVNINSNCIKQKIRCLQKITLPVIYILMTITKKCKINFCCKINLNYPLDKNSECTWSNICFWASTLCFHSLYIFYGHVLSMSWAPSYLVQDHNSRDTPYFSIEWVCIVRVWEGT